MTGANKKALSKYIKRVMDYEGYRISDVWLRAAGDITESYIGEMLRGTASNPSVSKLKALARGLGVDATELFKVAAGIGEPETTFGEIDVAHALSILDLIKRIIASPELSGLMMEIVALSQDDVPIASRSIKSLNDAKRRERELRQKAM
jgi:transcriptional regulator with XRE-family HTH domain